mgnify:CR=1 FL=1
MRQQNLSSEKRLQMLEAPISRLIPKMAVPTIVAQLITTVYNLVDTYFVSSLGTYATAAVGVNSSMERLITLIGSLIGAGAGSYIARLLGADRNKDADNVLSASFATGLGLGVALMALGLAFLSPLVYALGATEECAVYSMQYARYVLMAAPFMIGSFVLNMCLRSEGSATFAMVGIGIGGVLNCILDPIFIFSMGLGVTGASMATAISKLVSFCILLWPYIRRRCAVHIGVKNIRFTWTDTKEVVSIGSTSFFRSAFGVAAGIVTNRVAGGFSTAALAAVSVANRVMEFPFAIILGFGQGYQPVAGFNWGAKRYDRVRQSLSFGMKVSFCGAVIMGVILGVFASPVMGLFNKASDPEVLRLGLMCIRLQCIALPIHAWGSIINMFNAAVGKAKNAIILSTARQGYCLIPVLLILPRLLGAEGLAGSQAAADLLSLAIIIPLTAAAFKLLKSMEEE